MAATREDIHRWFQEAKLNGATHLIVACDTFGYDDFPVHVEKVEDFWVKYEQYNKATNLLRVMEVYDMSLTWEEQEGAGRTWNVPPKEATA